MPMKEVEYTEFGAPELVDINQLFGFYNVKVVAPKKAYLLLPAHIGGRHIIPSGT